MVISYNLFTELEFEIVDCDVELNAFFDYIEFKNNLRCLFIAREIFYKEELISSQ